MSSDLRLRRLEILADEKWKSDTGEMVRVQMFGLPYAPREGKRTFTFSTASLPFGEQSAELLFAKRVIGMDEYSEWCARYIEGQRGLVAIVLATDEIDRLYERLAWNGMSEPMKAWAHFGAGDYDLSQIQQGSFMPFFQRLPIQICFVEEKRPEDENRNFETEPRMTNGIQGIESVRIRAPFNYEDRNLIKSMFPWGEQKNNTFTVPLSFGKSWLRFERVKEKELEIDVWLAGRMQGTQGENTLRIHDVTFHARGM